MFKIYNTAIVGGGASGLMTAVELLRGSDAISSQDVVLLERNDRVGKKLIATGNGQGNLMNDRFGQEFYHGDSSFISAFISNAKAVDLENYLNDLGIPLCTLKDGKKYPLSRQASAVLDIIRAFLSYKGCEEKTNFFVEEITHDGKCFIIKSKEQTVMAKSVVLAFGGAAAKQFGTDGSSYVLAQSFGHKKTPIYPSLVQLKTDVASIRGLKGLKEVAKVTVCVGEKVLSSSTGDLLFTDYGVSGSTVFQVSASLRGEKDENLKIEFLPDLSLEEVENLLKSREERGYIDKNDILCGILNKRVGQAVLKTAKSLSYKDVARAIKDFRLKILGNLGFNYAQVTKGGIKTDKIDQKTYQSKLQKNLYIVGEALDVDGDCGGYNVTFAFISGICAAKGIKAKNKE